MRALLECQLSQAGADPAWTRGWPRLRNRLDVSTEVGAIAARALTT